jgi:hypothetical protein
MYTESFWYPCHGRMRSSRSTSRTRIASAMTVSNPVRLSLLTPLPQVDIFFFWCPPGTGAFRPGAALENRRPFGGAGPPVPEGVPYLLLRYPSRAVVARLKVGKAGHELFPARGNGCCQGIRKDRAVLIGQGVKESGISDGIGLPVQRGKVAGVRDDKMHGQTRAAAFSCALRTTRGEESNPHTPNSSAAK